jgi:hypothetical protein
MGLDGIEHFVSRPELQSEGSIGTDPLPPGQVFAGGPGGHDGPTSDAEVRSALARIKRSQLHDKFVFARVA